MADDLARALFAAQLVPSTPHVWVHLAESEKDRWRNLARVAVDTLAAAGRLLPEGGETREQWGTVDPESGGSLARVSEVDARDDLARSLVPCIDQPYRPCVLVVRDLTIWPGGGSYVGPWQPVDTEGGLPYTMTRPIDSEALGEDRCEAVEMLPADTEGEQE